MGKPAGNWFDQNAPAATAPPASSGSGGDWFSQNAPGAAAAKTTKPGGFWDAVEGKDVEVPLTSHAAATEQGALNVVSGVSKAVQGAAGAIAHPINTLENIGDVATLGLTHLMPGGNTAPGGETVNAIKSVPQKIKQLNASPDKTGAYLHAAGKVSGDLAGQALVGAATEGLRLGGARAVRAVKDVTGVPEALSQDTASTMATIAHNEGLPPLTSTTAREASDELQQSFIKRAKDQYAIVDKAVGGDLKPVQERIQQLKKAIRAQANVNPDLADKYIDQLADQQKTLQQLIEKAKANGVPNAEQIIASGDKDYARGMAMKKISAGVKTASGEVKMGGHPHPQVFASQIDRMNNTGILQRALGPDGAQAMMDTAKEGLRKFKNAQNVKRAIKIGAGTAGAAAAGTVGYHVARSLTHSGSPGE